MDTRLLGEADRIFETLLDEAPDARDARAKALCDGDAALLALVRRLLAHAGDDASTERLHDSALWQETMGRLAAPDALPHGESLGEYRLLRRLGHGGSAEVYLAERSRDGVLQRVAIKLMLADAVDAVGLQRFRQEQQILARLSHPGIGRIFDVGLSSAGRPYFVMEYVDGEPIDRHCDRNALDLRARLRLLVQVVDAVAHAHRALVVHRDIKPGNVLVDGHGVPRLVDFGIAKVLDGDEELTHPGGAPGTLGYASPEQLSGRPVGVPSDIYQLGMLGFVLLAGQRPEITGGAGGLGTAERQALQHARPSPSARLRELIARGERDRVQAIAASRRMRVDALLRGLGGDLDRVVLKAIAPDPAERYLSAPHFADDLRNVLAHRPVAARAPTLRYLLARAIRRHALLSATLAVAVIGLLAFSVTVALLAWRLDQARQRAEHQGQLAGQVTDFLIDAFRAAEPERSGAKGSMVKTALDRAAAAPPTRYVDDPGFNAQLHLVLGRAYESLHEYGDAQREYERALAVMQSLPQGDRDRLEVNALNALGRIALRDSQPAAALRHFRRVIAATEGDDGARALRAAALANSANAYVALGDDAAALRANAGAVEEFSRLYGPGHPQSIRIGLSRVQLLANQGRYAPAAHVDEALALCGPLLARAAQALGADDPVTTIVRVLHARLLGYAGRHDEAVAALRDALPRAAGVLGEQDLYVLNGRRELGVSLARLGAFDDALAQIGRAIDGFDDRFGDRHPDLHRARFDRALALALAGRERAARAALDGADLEFVAREPALLRLVERAPDRFD